MKRRKNISAVQNAVIHTHRDIVDTRSFFAEVTAVNSKNNTCEIALYNGSKIPNIPVRTKAGLIDDKVYGELDMPAVGDIVVIEFIAGNKVITGTIIPYLVDRFQSNQEPVNSSNKQFTLKLLEEDKEDYYRRIFKSGTTFEVQDDGTIILETPSGAYVQMDEANGVIIVSDPNGNIITIDSSGVTIDDTNGNNITMGSSSVTVNGNLEVLQ